MTGPQITNDQLISQAADIDLADTDVLPIAQAVSDQFGTVTTELQAAQTALTQSQSDLSQAKQFAADDATRQTVAQHIANALTATQAVRGILDALVTPPAQAQHLKRGGKRGSR